MPGRPPLRTRPARWACRSPETLRSRIRRLPVAVSLAAGAASLASAFPVLSDHLLAVCLIALFLLTVVNLRGIADSARVLMLPAVLFIVSVIGVIVVGLFRAHPAVTVGTSQSFPAVEALGVLLVLKAFSAGCSALTGVEAIANAVPMFRPPRIKRAQHTELMLGLLLGAMLVGLSRARPNRRVPWTGARCG